MNFADHADALKIACGDLIGVNLKALGLTTLSGQIINSTDCDNVRKAMLAVEMGAENPCAPVVGFATIASVEMFEGDVGTKDMIFKVHLSSISELPVSMDYDAGKLPQFNPLSDADNGSDFLPSKGTLVIPAGQQDGQIAVTIKGDKQVEGDERFQLYITNVTNAELTTDPYGVIKNDD